MARLSINEVTTFRWSFEEDVTHYARRGVPAIGIWRQKLADFGEERGREMLRDSGLAVAHLMWAGGFTGIDGRSFRDSVDDAIAAVRTAGALGSKVLIVHGGGRGGHTHNHARRLICQAVQQLLPHAEEHGVYLAVEPMHPACAMNWTMLTSLGEAVEFVARFESEHVGLVFDTFHWGCDPHILDRIPAVAPHLKLVQLADTRARPTSDGNRCCLGQGVVPLCEIVEALSRAGYDGDYDVELLGDDISEMDYCALLDHVKEMYGKLFATIES